LILTVTMNPSVDISYPLTTLELDAVNRSTQTRKTAGGKGLNVTRVISLMKTDVLATGIVGGTVGMFIEKELLKEQIQYDFFKTEQESRNCIAILHEGKQTEILEAGPEFTKVEERAFFKKFAALICEMNLVTISGSLPLGIDPMIYHKMIKLGKTHQVKTLLDCSGNALKLAISNEPKPYLIKPNHEELCQLLEMKIPLKVVDLKAALLQDIFNGIEWIVVSLGANGALVKVKNDFYKAEIPKINVINPVGSGDATMAGLAAAIAQEKTVEDIIKTAMTTGMLNALEVQTGSINYDNFSHYFKKIVVHSV